MFGKKSSEALAGQIDSLIGAKTRIEGNLQFEGGLRVDGRVHGNLHGAQNSLLLVSEHALLEGDIRSAQAIINGQINGTLNVAERLELQPKARIVGDVHYHTLEMHPGAVIEGRLIYKGATEAEPIITLDIEPATSIKKSRQAA